MCVFGVLAGLMACGDDDGSDGNNTKDAGGIVKPIDGGVVDSSAGNIDANVNPGNDSGQNNNTQTGDCVSGTPTKLTDFLNHCTTSNVVTVSKPMLGIPAALLDSNGNVLPL
jgi:hypothetical protein